jgi:hypothetical protein
MVQKYLAMVAVLGAIALTSIGMVTTGINQVKADGFGSFGPGGWHCDWQYNSNGYKVCESYNQKPTVQSIDWHCIWQKDSNGYDVCISAIQQPTVQSTGYYTHVGSHLVFVDGSCPCGNGKGFWTCANCDSYTQQPTIKQTSINCDKNYDGSWTCAPEASTQSAQPTVQRVDCVSCENGCGCYGSSAINQPAISRVEWGSICGSGGCFNGNHICSDGDSCNSAYTQHPTFQQVDNSNGDCGQRGFSWENCGYEQPQQPTIQGVAFVQPVNCFWSYPVQCN